MSHESGQNQQGAGRAFFWGALLGGLVGAVMAVWRAPRSGAAMRHMLESQVRRQVEGDPIDEAIREGKAEARRLNRKS